MNREIPSLQAFNTMAERSGSLEMPSIFSLWACVWLSLLRVALKTEASLMAAGAPAFLSAGLVQCF